ncbi:MAG: succinate dehydrogenase assembly factor 2 [Pseudomonadales bacterium]|nr:succinate dehydrogenase assembly factor 2 [Pseudomonadales bacterium]
MTNSTEYNRFWWHSRRGMLELDLVLLPFLENNYASFSESEIESYRALLESEDQDLFSWLVTGRPPEPEHANMVNTIREYVHNR